MSAIATKHRDPTQLAKDNLAALIPPSDDALTLAKLQYCVSYEHRHSSRNRRCWSIWPRGEELSDDTATVQSLFMYAGEQDGRERWGTVGVWVWSVSRGRAARYVDEVYIKMAQADERKRWTAKDESEDEE